jgi:hypothetical protein
LTAWIAGIVLVQDEQRLDRAQAPRRLSGTVLVQLERPASGP